VAGATARAVQRAAEPDSGLDEYLTERGWPTRQGAVFVMLADLPLGAAVPEIPADTVLAANTVLAGSIVLPASPVLPADTTVRVSLEPDPAWAATYHYRGQDRLPPVALQVLTSAREQVFISLTAGDTVLAIARLSLDGGLAGLTAVEVHPAHRRHGLGRAITALACDMAARRGAGRAFLQVEIDNGPARALYESLGFRYSHRYQYRIAPGQ
jgi:ribosomal protein S18 acetylase RimI-like enzyme